jgi:hypothetical protein
MERTTTEGLTTHAIYIADSKGTPKVIPINSSLYKDLLESKKEFVIGSEEECNKVAEDIQKLITENDVDVEFNE